MLDETAGGRLEVRMVSYKRVFNLGDYESVSLEESVVLRPDPDEDEATLVAEGWERVKADVKEQATAILAWRKSRREDNLKAQMLTLPPHLRRALQECLQAWTDDAELAGDHPDDTTDAPQEINVTPDGDC